MCGRVITIDGPAGSGKSTIAKRLADLLGFTHFDSGAVYRAIALYYLRNDIPRSNWPSAVASVPLGVDSRNGRTSVLLAGKCVDTEIRTAAVSNLVSPVSNTIEVRKRVNAVAGEFAQAADLVADGRDMGSVVFPSASVKVFLDADETERARRRLRDFLAIGRAVTLDEVLAEQRARDENDRTKPWGALVVPEGAIVIDTTGMSPDEVLDAIEVLARRELGL